jgi:hypothetical protein
MPGADESWILVGQVLATLFMTGLIWFVQIVHYPLFDRVGESFTAYHRAHSRWTTWVVGPPMLIEAATCLWTAVRPPQDVPGWQASLGLGLLVTIWISTATLQVPQHRRLARGFETRAYRRLVATNWLRVVAWSLRALLVVSWVF